MAVPQRNLAIECNWLMPNNPINSHVQKRHFALLFHAGYGDVHS